MVLVARLLDSFPAWLGPKPSWPIHHLIVIFVPSRVVDSSLGGELEFWGPSLTQDPRAHCLAGYLLPQHPLHQALTQASAQRPKPGQTALRSSFLSIATIVILPSLHFPITAAGGAFSVYQHSDYPIPTTGTCNLSTLPTGSILFIGLATQIFPSPLMFALLRDYQQDPLSPLSQDGPKTRIQLSTQILA